MKNKQLHKSFFYIVLTVLLLIVSVISGGFMVPAFAETDKYTDVLDDLQKAENFDVNDYPLIPSDYSLKVIQIGEGVNDELFIYVYQPCGENKRYTATSINISPTVSMDKNYENFDLQLINSSGTFFKYKVVNYYSIVNKQIRYYEISSIYRKWYNDVDGTPEYDNTVSEKAYPVGQCWSAVTVNDDVVYSCADVEFVSVTSQMVAFRRYNDGLEWSGIEYCDAHYIAFSCDHEIDKLLSADVSFYTQSYELSSGKKSLGNDKRKHFITVDADDKGASKKETWQRLSSTTDFIKELDITGKEKETLSKYDWIINFYETEYERDIGGKDILIDLLVPGGFIWSIVNACTTYGVLVTDVTLMRLEFEYAGKIYNLGVVSDKQSGSILPPVPDGLDDIPWWVWLIVAIVALLVLVIAFQILGLFFPIFKAILSGVWWLICLPFRGIKALIQKIRGDE